MNQSKTDLGIVNESQSLRFGITLHEAVPRQGLERIANSKSDIAFSPKMPTTAKVCLIREPNH
jgi:hypothetical protein